jgi:hypothetical protein
MNAGNVNGGFCRRQEQGCQMVCFQAKNLGIFWWAWEWKSYVHFMTTLNILRPFGIFYGRLVYFMAVWYR